MAELILKVKDSINPAGYKDGDILVAPNDRRIGCVHANHICDVRKTGFNRDGLRPDSIAREFRTLVYEYRFGRISRHEVRRTNLRSLDEEVFGPTPNAKGEHINVPLFIQRRLMKPDHQIFGDSGSEYWFGGDMDLAAAKITLVWQMIEGNTLNRRSDFTRWPLGNIDKRNFLACACDDFDDDEANNMTSPLLSAVETNDAGEPIMLKRRKQHVEWRALSEVSKQLERDIDDRAKEIDLRESFELVRAVTVKQRLV